jgi:Arc/MetJ family transcription regulator
MAKNDLLKEAIADAKTVRNTALANAKAALEEAFTPKLKSMLSARLTEELEEEVDEDMDEMKGFYENENIEEEIRSCN